MRLLVVAALLIGAAGCAVAPPKFTESDVAQARQFPEAERLYNQLQGELAADASSANAQTYRSMLARLGSRLATLRTEEVRSAVDEARLDSGAVPAATLDSIAPEVAEMRAWDSEVWRMVAGEMASERERTETLLDRARSRLERASPENEPVLWVENLESIAELSGAPEEQRRADLGREAAVNAALDGARTSLRVRDYPAAMRRTQQALALQPESTTALELQRQARAGMMAGRLTAALEAGDIVQAETVFDEIREQDWSPAARRQFDTPISLLGEYYAASLYDMLETRRYERAYRGLSNLRELDAWLDRDFDRTLDFLGAINYTLQAIPGFVGDGDRNYNWLNPTGGSLSGAIQVGIWESLYEDDAPLDLAGGAFSATGLDASGEMLLQTAFDAVNGVTGALDYTALDPARALLLISDTRQDVIVGDMSATVPAPAPAALMLAGLALLARRRAGPG